MDNKKTLVFCTLLVLAGCAARTLRPVQEQQSGGMTFQQWLDEENAKIKLQTDTELALLENRIMNGPTDAELFLQALGSYTPAYSYGPSYSLNSPAFFDASIADSLEGINTSLRNIEARTQPKIGAQ